MKLRFNRISSNVKVQSPNKQANSAFSSANEKKFEVNPYLVCYNLVKKVQPEH